MWNQSLHPLNFGEYTLLGQLRKQVGQSLLDCEFTLLVNCNIGSNMESSSMVTTSRIYQEAVPWSGSLVQVSLAKNIARRSVPEEEHLYQREAVPWSGSLVRKKNLTKYITRTSVSEEDLYQKGGARLLVQKSLTKSKILREDSKIIFFAKMLWKRQLHSCMLDQLCESLLKK